MGLACARRPVGEYGGVVAVQHRLDERLDRFLIDLLRGMILVDLVESVSLLFRTVVHLQHFLILGLELQLDGIQNHLNRYESTIKLSCTLMMS